MNLNHTQNYALPSWESSDRILMEDFNDAFETIDTQMKARNCRFYTASYTGDGAHTRTHTFPAKPYFIIVTRGSTMLVMLQGSPEGYHMYSTLTQNSPDLVWSGNSVTVGSGEINPMYISNTADLTYTMFAVLDADG